MPIALLVAQPFDGLSFATAAIAFISLIPNAANEHEHIFGTRREGIYFAGYRFAAKRASGVGLLIAGLVLQLIDFPVELADQTAVTAVISPSTVMWLGIASGIGPAIIAVTAAILSVGYRIDRQAHRRIMSDLLVRRGE